MIKLETAMDAALQRFYDECGGLGVDELRILTVIAKRLQQGRVQYGVWTLATDKRDWQREAGEEMADALVYLAAHELTKGETR